MRPLATAMKSIAGWLLAGTPLFSVLNPNPNVSALRILISNEDSWGTANVRALFRVLSEAGHDVVVSAPVKKQKKAGMARERPERVRKKQAEFGLLAEGDEALGHNPEQARIRYVGSTPCTSSAYGISMGCPRFFQTGKPDLFIAGVNEGAICGKRCASSGAFNAGHYILAETNIPTIVVSAANEEHRDYRWIRTDDDQAYMYAHATLDLVSALEAAAVKAHEPLHDVATLRRSGSMRTANSKAGNGEIVELEPPPSSFDLSSKGGSGPSSSKTSVSYLKNPLLPRDIGLNVNLADAEGVSEEEWAKKWWVLTRMFKGKWESRLSCFGFCNPNRLPAEEDFRHAKDHDQKHTISVFRVNTTNHLLEATDEDMRHIRLLLNGRLPHFHSE